MKNIFLGFFTFYLLFNATAFAQVGWTWTPLDTMPNRISNNAVCEAKVGSDYFVYSFSGIDTTKLQSGISLNSYKYNVQTGNWSTIPSLPDTMGKIAAGASFVNDKIYIIGGYYVLPNGTEVSSQDIHVFDPVTDAYLSNGAVIPVAIDDHVQAVWRDSLIYVITGWSNTGNVPNVQIYNPYLNSWEVGTDTPNDNYFMAFGASGTILGDTIYYNGGVRGGFNFMEIPFLRKGVIDPNDPTQITWTQEEDNPGASGYRMACSHYESRIFWVGGGDAGYNYNGLAYSNGAGVEPLERILQFEKNWDMWFEGLGSPYGVMDLRGIAQVGPTSWIIAGGMEAGQVVTNKSFRIDFDPIVGSISERTLEVKLYPNPVVDILRLELNNQVQKFVIYNCAGAKVSEGVMVTGSVDVSKLLSGSYLLLLLDDKGSVLQKGRFVK
jgi:hypothetical protein